MSIRNSANLLAVRLNAEDADRVLTFVRDAASLEGPRPFTTPLVEQLTTVVASEFAAYYTFDPTDLTDGEYVPCSWEPMPPEGWGGLPAVVDTRRHDVQLWSDTLSRAVRWRYESASFAEAAGLVDCAWTVIPVGPRVSAMLNFHRQDRDFTERDRRVVEALRPHVVALIAAADARRRLADLMAALDSGDAAEQGGFVLLGPGHAVEHASARAHTLLGRWFEGGNGRLPASLADWLRSGPDRAPLRLEQGGRRLVVEAVTPTALVLREEAAPAAALTAREHEILRLIAAGWSTAQIARELWVTPATVSKHLEHCYRKLGVRSRTAALAAIGLTSEPPQ